MLRAQRLSNVSGLHICLAPRALTYGADLTVSECIQKHLTVCPSEAGVGDAFAVCKIARSRDRLVAAHKMTFNHHTTNRGVSSTSLVNDTLANANLLRVIFLTICVAAIDH